MFPTYSKYSLSFLMLLLVSFFANVLGYTVPHPYLNTSFTHIVANHLMHDINSNARAFSVPLPYTENAIVLFDLLDISSEVSNVVTYEFRIAVALSECNQSDYDPRLHHLAECGLIPNYIWELSYLVVYSPRVSHPDVLRFAIKSGPHRLTTSSLPLHPEFLGFSLPVDAHELFASYEHQHNRPYGSEERRMRFSVFKSNLLRIQLMQKLDKGSAIYGISKFADLTPKEFQKIYANMKRPEPRRDVSATSHSARHRDSLPLSFDWRTRGAVTAVKDQGSCGSCWAFSVTGNIEGQWFLKTNQSVSLSEQQLLDCDSKDEACNGGLPEWAFKAIQQMGGLMSESDYPYKAEKEQTCKLSRAKMVAYINDSVQLPSDEFKLADWLSTHGPISVGINANFLQFYLGGVSHPPHILCSKEGLNHAVLLVGYGFTSFWHSPYWIVKNSWGDTWGEDGYFRVYRGDGTCGINEDATSSMIK